jgi:hypothetical protein
MEVIMMTRQMKKPLMLLLLIAMFSMTLSGAVFAQGKSDKNNDTKLDRYHPNSIINVETAVSLIVQRLHLNIDNMRFIKAPLASDYYTKVNDQAWYANNFVIAHYNGVKLPKDIDPNANVTKEEFAAWLYGAMSSKGEYPTIEIYMLVTDEDQVSKGMMNSIQKLLITKVATLDKLQKFYPKNGMKRGDAVVMIERVKNLIEQLQNAPAPEPKPETPIFSEIQVTSEKHSEQATQVTLTAMAPHPGYGFEVASIVYSNGEAQINYRIIMPNPEMMYPQVLTEVTAVTYIPSQFKPVLGISETINFPVE